MLKPQRNEPLPLEIAIIGLRHPHATSGHEPVGWTDTLTHVPELRVAALCDRTVEGRALSAHYFPTVPIYSDIASLLTRHRSIRAALVLLPNDEMGAALTELTEAGIHVALDKPGARASGELERALRAVREQRLVTAVAYLWRMKPLVREVRQLVREGSLGSIWSVEGRLLATSVSVRGPASHLFSKVASGGGVLHWLGCHWLDLIRFLTGSEIRSVSALSATVSGAPIDVEDLAVLTMELDGTTIATLMSGYLLPAGHHAHIALRGRNGRIDADMTNGSVDTYINGASAVRVEGGPVGLTGASCYGGQAGVDFLRAFAHAVIGRERVPTVGQHDASTSTATHYEPADVASLEDAARVLAVIGAAYASAAEGRAIEPSYIADSV